MKGALGGGGGGREVGQLGSRFVVVLEGGGKRRLMEGNEGGDGPLGR